MALPQSLVLTDEAYETLVTNYKYLHQHPELSMAEHQTVQWLEEQFTALGLETFRCAGTGLVAVLKNGEGPTVGYRADTDGLPVREDTGLDYASTATALTVEGEEHPAMHACGHDTHMSMALATATLFANAKDTWSGTLVFILQPGEETAAGAKAMVEDGLWDKAPKAEIVYGQHVMGFQAGKATIVPGAAMAMADSWKVTVKGRGSHGSMPEAAIDPIVAGAAMVTRLQTVVSREIGAKDTAVVTIGTFHAGVKENVIPDQAVFTLNVRTFTPKVREKVLGAIERIIKAEAAASGAPEPLIEEISRFPMCFNDPAESEKFLGEAQQELGEEAVQIGQSLMGSEDVGALADALGVPLVYWMLGGFELDQHSEENPVPGNHSPFFAPVIDPTLRTGVRLATTALYSKLGK